MEGKGGRRLLESSNEVAGHNTCKNSEHSWKDWRILGSFRDPFGMKFLPNERKEREEAGHFLRIRKRTQNPIRICQ